MLLCLAAADDGTLTRAVHLIGMSYTRVKGSKILLGNRTTQWSRVLINFILRTLIEPTCQFSYLFAVLTRRRTCIFAMFSLEPDSRMVTRSINKTGESSTS
jgi:hypothetical protein